jgi:ATPase subunit of ABC transporter with duplicated ATPase domains
VAHPYLKAQSLTHHFGGELLFRGVDLVVNPGDRIGLVGPNGVGKTTLLRVLAGELPPAGGHVTAGASIGWSGAAAQPDAGGGARTIGPYLAAGLGRLAVLAARMRTLEAALATADPGHARRVCARAGRMVDAARLDR